MGDLSSQAQAIVDVTLGYCANNYIPFNIPFKSGEGVWVTDVDGNRYLDMLSAYSALNFGHRNPRIERAAIAQLQTLTLTSRAFYNDQLGLMCKELAELSGMEMVIPMNSGAEAVETAIKLSRKWGYEVKGIETDRAEILCFYGNFHGRTTTVISFSDAEKSKKNFGPLTPGFKLIPFGNIDALTKAVTKNTAAILLEPIQGEGGVVVPPAGYLQAVRDLCTAERVLMVADEIQTGLCRTGERFACDHEKVKPDVIIVAKSLGGGITPLSAVMSSKEILGLFVPGTHGSTFGGNPFACAIAREVIAIIKDEKPEVRAKELGDYFMKELRVIQSPAIKEVRGKGLLIGVEIKAEFGKGKDFVKKLLTEGVICYDTREQTIRFAPPLVISKDDLDWGLGQIRKVFTG